MKKIDIYVDGASIKNIRKLNKKKFIKGFTTNPSLMRFEGVTNYEKFIKKILSIEKKKPISFEVFSDDEKAMYREAKILASYGNNIFVKIPVTDTKGNFLINLINKCNEENIKCNITAVFTFRQFKLIADNIKNKKITNIISVFAGRIADTGKDPAIILKKMKKYIVRRKNLKLLWASTREPLNIIQAEKINCDIITVPYSMIDKLKNFDKDLEDFSLDTVMQFYKDAKKSKYYL